jgi:hypothetical protein
MCVTRHLRVPVPSAVLAVMLVVTSGLSRADDDRNSSVRAPGSPAVIASSYTAPAAVAARSGPTAATIGRPVAAATLGVPVPLAGTPFSPGPAPVAGIRPYNASTLPGDAALAAPVTDRAVATASYETAPGSQNLTVRLQAPDPPPPLTGPAPVPPPGFAPAVPPISAGDVPPPPSLGAPGTTYGGLAVDQPIKKSFLDRCKDIFSPGSPDSKCGGWFQSDHAFDNACNAGDLISPVSMPFLFEDPRALTEVRPLFFYQTSPNRNPAFSGGSSEFYGIQARVAFTERWSLVISELGLVSLQPHDSDVGLTDKTGFAEVRLGPKWTFYRDEQAGRVAAAGVAFDIPAGDKSVFQNTGSLSLDPYVTFGQTFGRSSYGTFNVLAAAGFWFSVDDERTDYIHAHLHLDYDVANLHRIYPLIELNWLHTTSFGKANQFVGTEGADLVNFGSNSYDGKRDLVTLALGARYKFGGSDHYQVGTSFEFPLTDRKDLQAFRFGLDFIIRY